MNERIKQLAVQAGFFPERNWDHTGWHAGGHDDIFEKFAELIVRECVFISRTSTDGFTAGRRMEQHFGVE